MAADIICCVRELTSPEISCTDCDIAAGKNNDRHMHIKDISKA
jgi:hypothetical protein